VALRGLLIGGTFMGAGIGIMHYVGMAAMRFDGFVRYDPKLFLASIVVAVALADIALLITRRVVSYGDRDARSTLPRDITGALFMGLAVAGMHYTAMTSTLCFASPGAQTTLGLDPQVFAAVTTAVAGLVLAMVIGSVVFDR